jgi:hypothetical protein
MAAATLQRLLPHWGDKIGEGAINTKPTTFLLSPTSTTLSSAAYLLSLLRHCADTPLAILSSSLPTGELFFVQLSPPKKIYTLSKKKVRKTAPQRAGRNAKHKREDKERDL